MFKHPVTRIVVAVFLSLLTSATIVLLSRATILSATRWGWLIFFFYVTAELAYSDQGKQAALSFRKQYGEKPLMSYILVPLSFAILGLAFWIGINKIYKLGGAEPGKPKAEEPAAMISVGSLAFERTEVVLRQQQGSLVGWVQPGVVLHNTSSALLKYDVKHFSATAAGKLAGDNYVNRGGFIYAGRESTFRGPAITGIDLSTSPITGTIEYEIAYGTTGGLIRTTKKKVSYELVLDPVQHTGQHVFTILEEEER